MTFLRFLAFASLCAFAWGQSERLYTKPEATDTGGLKGAVDSGKLTHAVAVDQRLQKVFLAKLDSAGRAFTLENLPVAKYDLVLVTDDGRVIEGVVREGKKLDDLDSVSASNLRTRIAKADSFFNQHKLHRAIVGEDRAWVFVERVRDKLILKQSGEELNAYLRRFEIVELQKAGDDWQMQNSRHIYREEIPKGSSTGFFTHQHEAALGNIRVAASMKDIGVIKLPAR